MCNTGSQLGIPEWPESHLCLKKHGLCSWKGRKIFCDIVNAYLEMSWDVAGRPREKHDWRGKSSSEQVRSTDVSVQSQVRFDLGYKRNHCLYW